MRRPVRITAPAITGIARIPLGGLLVIACLSQFASAQRSAGQLLMHDVGSVGLVDEAKVREAPAAPRQPEVAQSASRDCIASARVAASEGPERAESGGDEPVSAAGGETMHGRTWLDLRPNAGRPLEPRYRLDSGESVRDLTHDAAAEGAGHCSDLAFWRENEPRLELSGLTFDDDASVWGLFGADECESGLLADLLSDPPSIEPPNDSPSRSPGEWSRVGGRPANRRPGLAAARSDAWNPRFHLNFSRTRGDDGTGTGVGVGAFNRLFPLSHTYLGYEDVIGREHTYDISLGTSLQPARSFTVSASLHWLRSESAGHPLTTSTGRMMPANEIGAWPEIGAELDISLNYRMGSHASLLIGYGRFFASDFVTDAGPSQDVDFVYANMQYTF